MWINDCPLLCNLRAFTFITGAVKCLTFIRLRTSILNVRTVGISS